MARKSYESVILEVNVQIERAIHDNQRQEWVIISLLVLLFFTGLSMVIYWAYRGSWPGVVLGVLLNQMIVFPIRRLIELRADNKSLRILIQLLRLAKTLEAKKLAAEFAAAMIRKVST